jgi:hypothetical protein
MSWREVGEVDRFGLHTFRCDQCHRLAVAVAVRDVEKSPCVCRRTSAPRKDKKR